MGTRDLETARTVKLRPIEDVAETLGLAAADLEPYGSYKAKVRWGAIERSRARPDGALVLVTAMTPTPAGEGKSTTTIGLADGLRKLGTRSIAALRQPALGPLFGAKGGATGGAALGADGGDQPALHRRHARGRGRPQSGRRDGRQSPGPGQRARPRSTPDPLEARRGHERPRAPQHRRRPRRSRPRRAARERLRDHRSLRGHGDLLPGDGPARL